METRLIKSQTLYPIISFGCIIATILFSFIGFFLYHSYLYLYIICLLILSIIMQSLHTQQINKKLLLLIQMSENILEQKDISFPIIDGESYIAVLYSHLALLDKRMKGMLARLKQEQKDLQKYIEDISHQIKTPLTSMLLKEDILLERLHEDRQKHDMEQIIAQTQNIQEFIQSLLNLAQLNAQSITYHKKEYDLDELINSIEEHLEPLLEEYQVTLCLHNEHQIIYCDFQWMKEALENIIKNCIEQKSHSTIDITCRNESSYIEIRIQDYGPGFKPEDLPHIFERFYRSQYQKKGQGIGIGLSITKGIINDHHGTIQAVQNNGALFIITLPSKNTKSKYDSH